MRIYCLVVSYSPLTAYLYRSGFGRFTFHRFTMASEDMSNSYIHLTNVAIQKTAPDYDPASGCKWELRFLKQYLISRHGEAAANGPCEDMCAYPPLFPSHLLSAVGSAPLNACAPYSCMHGPMGYCGLLGLCACTASC